MRTVVFGLVILGLGACGESSNAVADGPPPSDAPALGMDGAADAPGPGIDGAADAPPGADAPPATGDGSGAFVATLLRAASNNDFYFGGTVSPQAWVTRRDYVACDFAAAIDVAPGVGNRWTFTAEAATLGAGQACADLTAWTQAALCTISDTGKSCTAGDIALPIAGPACLRGHAVLSPGDNQGNYAGQGTGGTVSFHCRDAAGDGATHFQGTGQAAVTGAAFFGGDVARSPDADRAHWIHAGPPLASCGGAIALPAAPAAGETWHIRLAASTTPLASGQNCLALAYTTTADLCTIAGAAKECDWAPAAISVPTGGCLQLRATCTGGACAPGTISPNYGLDCSSDSASPFDGGGPTYQSAGSGSFDAAHELGPGPWGISDANHVSRQLGQQYWLAPPSGLAQCGGGFTFQNAITGSGQFDVGLLASTTAPGPGQGCLDLTYSTTPPLCSLPVGSRSCWFAPSALAAVPAGACFALDIEASGGTPVSGPNNNFNWQASCTAD